MPDTGKTLNTLLNVSMDGVIVFGHDDVIIGWNDRAEHIFGYSADAIIGKVLAEMLLPASERAQYRANLARYLQTGEAQILGQRVQAKGLHANGQEIALELGVMTTTVLGPENFIAFVRDVTLEEEAKIKIQALQKDLDHLTRVSAMGTIASMIAHELNQPLTAAANYLSVTQKLLQQEKVPASILSAIAESRDAIFHAGSTIKSVRELVARSQPITTACSLTELVQEALRHMLKQTDCRITVNIAPDADEIVVNRMQVEQVLHNLMTNALEAMDGVKACALTIEGHKFSPDQVVISVTDTGSGMSDATFEALFSPFTETEKVGGLGLGLSICRTIVEQHHGRIWAERSPGKTTFCFTLPKAPSG